MAVCSQSGLHSLLAVVFKLTRKYLPESLTFTKSTTASAFLIGYSRTNGQQSFDKMSSLKHRFQFHLNSTTWVAASSATAALVTLASILMLYCHCCSASVPSFEVVKCCSIQHAILGHTCLQCVSLSTQPLCPFSHSRPMNTRCSSPFCRYCIHVLATGSTSLSSFHPPVLQQRGPRGSQCIFLPSSSCGRMSFHSQFAARNSSKRRYSLWELHVPASVWSL